MRRWAIMLLALLVAGSLFAWDGWRYETRETGWQLVEPRENLDDLLIGWHASCGLDLSTHKIRAFESNDAVRVKVIGRFPRFDINRGCTGELTIGCALVRLEDPLGDRKIRGLQVRTTDEEPYKSVAQACVQPDAPVVQVRAS